LGFSSSLPLRSLSSRTRLALFFFAALPLPFFVALVVPAPRVVLPRASASS